MFSEEQARWINFWQRQMKDLIGKFQDKSQKQPEYLLFIFNYLFIHKSVFSCFRKVSASLLRSTTPQLFMLQIESP